MTDEFRVTITVEQGDTVQRIRLLADAMLRVVQGARLLRVLSADFTDGCVELLLEGSPHCYGVSAKVTVEYEAVPAGV